MTKEEAVKTLKENYCSMCAYGSCDMDSCDISYCDNREAIEVLSTVPEREKGTDTERIKQILSELAQYNADMLKAFNAGKELAEREKGTDLEEIVEEIKRERAYRENRHEIEEMCEVDVILRIIEPYMRGE